MQVLESAVQANVLRWAKLHSVLYSKFNAVGSRGWPDVIFWIGGGSPTLIEFKRLGGKLRPLQVQKIVRLKKLGYDVQVYDSSAAAIRYLEETLRLPLDSR